MDDIEVGGQAVEYALIDGYKPGEKVRIGSVTAGDIIEWSEANEGDAKRTAGLRLITKSLVGPNRRTAGMPMTRRTSRSSVMRHQTERIVKEILKLNGMNVKADDAAKNG